MDWSEEKCLRLKLREIKPMMQRRKITFKLEDHHIQGAQNGEQHVFLINWKNNTVTRIQGEKWHWLRTQLKCQEGVWLFGVLEDVGSSLDFFFILLEALRRENLLRGTGRDTVYFNLHKHFLLFCEKLIEIKPGKKNLGKIVDAILRRVLAVHAIKGIPLEFIKQWNNFKDLWFKMIIWTVAEQSQDNKSGQSEMSSII